MTPPEGQADRRLSAPQKRHLDELRAIAEKADGFAYWTPMNAGEWSVARALERRGLIAFDPARGHHSYVFRLDSDD